MDNTIQEAIDAIEKVLSVHENHLYPTDRLSFELAKDRLLCMQRSNFN